jgi:nucleoid DNA-binding protein
MRVILHLFPRKFHEQIRPNRRPTKRNRAFKPQSNHRWPLILRRNVKALAAGDRVEIRGLFTMFVKEYKAYTGRNPKTKEAVQVPAKKLPFFKCGKELKDRVDYK